MVRKAGKYESLRSKGGGYPEEFFALFQKKLSSHMFLQNNAF